MVKGISEKSTKTEILEAYNGLLAQAKEQKAADQKASEKGDGGKRGREIGLRELR